MSVLPFRKSATSDAPATPSRPPRPSSPSSLETQRFLAIVNRYQVLALTNPTAASAVMDVVDSAMRSVGA